MISAKNVSKYFDKTAAIKDLSCDIPKGCIYGLVGSNGAGKSTFLRLLSGVYRAESGSITIDGERVYDNPACKRKIAFMPDELYFLSGANMERMAKMYEANFDNFSHERFTNLTKTFGLPHGQHRHLSKGMKRQAAIICAVGKAGLYLLTRLFDGLDPV